MEIYNLCNSSNFSGPHFSANFLYWCDTYLNYQNDLYLLKMYGNESEEQDREAKELNIKLLNTGKELVKSHIENLSNRVNSNICIKQFKKYGQRLVIDHISGKYELDINEALSDLEDEYIICSRKLEDHKEVLGISQYRAIRVITVNVITSVIYDEYNIATFKYVADNV